MSVIILQIDLALIASEKEIKGEKKKKMEKKMQHRNSTHFKLI